MKPAGSSSLPGPGESSSSSVPFASSPKYKGVRKRKWGKWVSEIRLPNSRERVWLGSFDSAEKAARAFDAALFCLRGRDAKFNFPGNPPDIVMPNKLTPQEIQAVAARFANEHPGPEGETGGSDQAMTDSTEPAAPQGGGGEHGMDWSFLGALDENEFLYDEIQYMTGDPPAMDGIGGDGDDDDNDNDGGSGDGGGDNYTHQTSFLWNF